jgi:hypothetical protein
MPIQIQNKQFTDIFANVTNYYVSNAGDPVSLEIEIHSNISISSLNNPLTLDISNYQIFSATLGWLDEGFRIGDTVTISIYDNTTAVPLNTYSATLNYVDNDYIEVNTLLGWYDVTLGQFATITVSNRDRDTLEISLNHVLNTLTGSEYSLIDGEVTRIKFDGINSLIVGGNIIGVTLNNKSGQFTIVGSLTRITNPGGNQRGYLCNLSFVNSGIYNQSWFASANCLKLFLRLSWSSLANEPFGQTIKIINDSANTGWFDEAFNSSVIDATLVQSVSNIDYSQTTTCQVVIDSASTNFGFGSCYLSQDATYYKNQTYSQSQLSMIIPTIPFNPGDTIASDSNPDGADYVINILSVSTVGTINTIDFEFVPSPTFTTFVDELEVGNRTFYIWFRFGNVNLLAFSGQMEKQPAIGGFIEPFTANYFDHSEQLTVGSSIQYGYESNTEDDLGFSMTFQLDEGVIYESLTAQIQAFNTVTGDSFTLFSTFFDFSQVPYNGVKHLLNFNQLIVPQLQTTSIKRNAILELWSAIDSAGKYGAHLYFPFINRWEYWLPQLNANVDFYPNFQTKNWVPYDNTGNWTIKLNVNLIKDGLSYIYEDDLTLKNYDSDPVIYQTIELIRDLDNSVVNVIIEGELMRVKVQNQLLNGEHWDIVDTWGQITIEPYESASRYYVSSVVDYDFNPNNPLSPMSGLLVPVTYPSGDIAQMECYLNPNIIDLTNGVKITCKIKGCASTEFALYKITTGGRLKDTTTPEQKIIC